MKKNMLPLRALLLLSVVAGSTFIVEANYSSSSYSYSSKSSVERKSNKKSTMKSIERDLAKIKRDFQRNHDAQQAHRKLDRVPREIKQAIADLKRNENSMWRAHERALNRKLHEVRRYVREHSNR